MPNEIAQLLEYASQSAAKIERPAAKSLCLTDIAGVYLQSGNKTKCLEVLSEALKSADTLKKPAEKAQQLASIARVYAQAEDSSKAKDLFTRATLLSRAAETPELQIEALHHIASEYADAGLYAEAEKILSELHGLVVNPELEIDSASELIDMAETYHDIGKSDVASTVLEEARKITASLQDHWFQAEHYLEIVEMYTAMGFRDNALQLLNMAQTAVDLIDEENRPYFLLRLADVDFTLDRKPETAAILAGISALVNRAEHPARISDLIQVAWRYLDLQDIPAAASLIEQIKTLALNLEDPREKINNLIEVSRLLDASGYYDQALEVAGQVGILCGSFQDHKSLPFALGNLVILYSELKDQVRASETLSRMVQVIRENPVKTSGLGVIVTDLAEAGEIRMALQLVNLIREPDVKADALSGIAENLIPLGDNLDAEIKSLIRELTA